MKFEQRQVVSASRDKLWDLLMDLPRVGQCFPGVDQVTAVDDQRYQGTMRVRVGPVSLSVSGTIQVVERDNDRWHASMRLDGADRRVGGAVQATMVMDLKELSGEETELVVNSDVSFMGKLGELGQPIMRRKADSVMREFIHNLGRELASPAA